MNHVDDAAAREPGRAKTSIRSLPGLHRTFAEALS